MQQNLSLAKIVCFLLFGGIAGCITTPENEASVGHFWVERRGETLALYSDPSKQDDCILATSTDEILRQFKDGELTEASMTYTVLRAPVFVPTSFNGEVAYDKPAEIRGRFIERMCASDDLYWIVRLSQMNRS